MLLVQLPCIPRQFRSFFNHPFCWETRSYSSTPIFSSLLALCSTTRLLQQVHTRLVLHGLRHSPSISSHLISRYVDIGSIDASLTLFNSMSSHKGLPYSVMIKALSLNGELEHALLLYRRMLLQEGPLCMDGVVYATMVRSCLEVRQGQLLHCHVIKMGFASFSPVGIAIMGMYGKVGQISNAQLVFEEMPLRNAASWNIMISIATWSGDHFCSLRLFNRMRVEESGHYLISIISITRSLADMKWLGAGESIHALAITSGLGGELTVSTALLTMYSVMGKLDMARDIFDETQDKDSVVWNAMISGYSQNCCPDQALKLFFEMGLDGFRADLFTAMACISSVAELRWLDLGRSIHALAVRSGSGNQVSVCNALIDMYSKCNRLDTARKVFDMLSNKSVVSWSTIIKAYLCNDRPSDAMVLFDRMKVHGAKQDSITLINILPACVHRGALHRAQNIHSQVIKQGFDEIVSLITVLLVTYAKCGCIEMARRIFDEGEINYKDIISWNSMISAYSKHGCWSQCFELYSQMKNVGVKPDKLTFLGLLTVCVSSGLVKQGRQIFHEMISYYDLEPGHEHYACMVDLFGRAGLLDEAADLIKTMPFKPDAQIWGPILSACKIHRNTKLAEFAAHRLIDMEPQNPANYVLLSNIYASSGKWDHVAKMRSFLRNGHLKKNPGYSWLEINGVAHKFRVADISHPHSEDIYALLGVMEKQSKMSYDDVDNELCR